jgi:hypothetical protein
MMTRHRLVDRPVPNGCGGPANLVKRAYAVFASIFAKVKSKHWFYLGFVEHVARHEPDATAVALGKLLDQTFR